MSAWPPARPAHMHVPSDPALGRCSQVGPPILSASRCLGCRVPLRGAVPKLHVPCSGPASGSASGARPPAEASRGVRPPGHSRRVPLSLARFPRDTGRGGLVIVARICTY